MAIIAGAAAIAAVAALPPVAHAQTTAGGVPAALSEWASLIAVLLSVGSIVYTRITAGSTANKAVLEDHGARLTTHAERLAQIENDIKHLPPKDDVTELKIAIAELKGTIGKLDTHLTSIASTVVRMDDYLRKASP